MSIKLIGEMNRSFGNFITLRGMAKMGVLEQISFADPAYQMCIMKLATLWD